MPVNRSTSPPQSNNSCANAFGTSPRSQRGGERTMASIAEDSFNRDLEDEDTERGLDEQSPENVLSRTSTRNSLPKPHSLLAAHRRGSLTTGAPVPILGLQWSATDIVPAEQAREAAISDERTLLEDNNIIIQPRPRDEESGSAAPPTETTALLPTSPTSATDDDTEIEQKWEDAILAGKIHTTWQRELKTLINFSGPLILTNFLQTSLTITSTFTVGHIGKNELGAVSLGSMTAAITGYCVYIGLATSLDTLCAQAYGSGKKKLVGLNLQRMIFFLWLVTIPIAILWFFAENILQRIVPEREVAILAGQYLRILVLGLPAYAAWESSKRYVQAQGKFAATMYVLLIAAPVNVLMHWLFVWRFKWGFIGCPIAIVLTEYLMLLLLFLYVRFYDPSSMDCWPGFSTKAFKNWGPMIRLALPGFVMVVAEFMAFEILVFASAQISATHLAANAILNNLGLITYQLPFPLSIAGSTRVANLIGATLPEAAKVTTKVLFVLGTILGIFNVVVLSSLRFYIPHLFSSEPDVIALAAAVLPLNAAFQLFDAVAAQCNGVLRGLGKQRIGGYVSLFAFYGIAIPISMGTAFGLHWDLYGLWAGPAVALFVQLILESIFIYKTDWQKASDEAAKRNAAG